MIIRLSNIGNDLKSLRKKLWLTQKEVAELSGFSRLTIITIETGITSPNVATVNRIINALIHTPEYKEKVDENIEMVFFSFDK